MATIATLALRLEADHAALIRGVDQANAHLDRMTSMAGTVAKSLGAAFSVGAVVSFAKEMTSFASQMSDVSAQTGIGVQALQALNYAAVGSGVSIDQLATSVSQLSKRLVEGSPGTVEAVQDLSLSLGQLRSMSPDQAFLAIADAIRQIPDPMKQSQIAMELFGKSGAQLLPLLKDNLRELVTEAYTTGSVISKELIEKADALDDAWARGTIRLKAFAMSMVEAALDAATMADTITREFNRAKDSIGSLTLSQTAPLPALNMTMSEADRIANELTQSVKKQIKAFEDNARGVEQAEAAHRAFTNWIGEREIEAIEDQQKAIVEMVRIEQDAFNARIDNLQAFADEQQRILDDNEAAWRNWQNELGLILMEQDRLEMEHNERMKFTWSDAFDSIGGFVDQFSDTFEGIVSDKWLHTMQHFQKAFHEARTVVSGVLRGLSGDFSGWVDAVMAGIRMVRAAWNGIRELFGGGEEGVHVNPARDQFLSQFAGMPGDFADPNNPPGFHGLAALLSSLSHEPGGGSLFAALTAADTMDRFNAATKAITDFLHEHGIPGFATGTNGLVDFGRGTLAMLHGREEVRTEAQVRGDNHGFAEALHELREDNERLRREMRRADERWAVMLAPALRGA